MRTDGQQGILLNVVVGVVGAILGGWLLSPLVGVSTINQSNFSVPGLLVSLGGRSIERLREPERGHQHGDESGARRRRLTSVKNDMHLKQ